MAERPPDPTTGNVPPYEEDPTRMMESTSPIGKKPPAELPRRGYERPMAPPPPPPDRYPPPNPPPVQSYTSPPPRSTPPAGTYPEGYSPPYQPVTAPPPVSPVRRATRVTTEPPPVRRKDSGFYLPWWSLVILVIVVGLGAFGMLYVVSTLADGLVLGDQTPEFIVVTTQPLNNPATSGNGQNPVVQTQPPGFIPPTAQPIQTTPVPQAQPSPTNIPGVTLGCPLNAVVQVVGTGTTGLSIRSEPIQGENIKLIARDGELFTIIEGPQVSTGVGGQIEFCRVQGAEAANRDVDGWAARQYLAETEQ